MESSSQIGRVTHQLRNIILGMGLILEALAMAENAPRAEFLENIDLLKSELGRLTALVAELDGKAQGNQKSA